MYEENVDCLCKKLGIRVGGGEEHIWRGHTNEEVDDTSHLRKMGCVVYGRSSRPCHVMPI